MRHWCAPCVAGLLALALIAPAIAEDLVVIESSSPQIAVGSVIASGAAITLPAGARAVLVSAAGRTVALAGPYSGTPGSGAAGGDSRLLTALASLVQRKAEDTSSVGAVRAGGNAWRFDTVASLADVMAIDLDGGGETCLYDVAGAEVARNPTSPSSSANIFNVQTGASAAVQWTKVGARMPWPKPLTLEHGQTYMVERPGQSQSTLVTIKVLSAIAPNDLQRAAQLAAAGCEDQARLLLALVAKQAK